MPSPLGYSSISYAKLTGNTQVNSLLYGTYWAGNTNTGAFTTSLTYSFMTMSSYFASDYSGENEYEAGYVLSSAQKNGIVSALGTWSSVANIKFQQVSETASNVGDLRFGGYLYMDDDTAAWGYFPGNTPSAGDVWLGPVTNDPAPAKGTYDYLVFMHEIGHALGLKHPFSPSSSNATVLSAQFDDVRYTIMSYNTAYSYEPTTPMLLDIAAIQSLYGANTQWQTGNNTYSWAVGQSVFETIWDAGGNDTIDASNQLAAVRINLNEGQFSKIGQTFLKLDTQTAFNEGLTIAYGAKIENAVGSANDDTLIGNALANLLNGRAGKDTMIGGAGNDTYVLDRVDELALVQETVNQGNDGLIVTYVASSSSNVVNLGLSNLRNVENVVLSGTGAFTVGGNELNNSLTGNASVNNLLGGAGNDTLDGGAGADTLTGGIGNDTYVVDNLKDIVSETSTLAGEIDTVRASLNWSLGANLENLTLTGSVHLNGSGNALNNVLIGNTGNNVLNGGAGNDTLDGSSGIDTLVGGTGNDTYVVDNLSDVISETSTLGGEIDTVRSSVTWTLGANLETLILTGSALLNGTGNALGNVLIGNAGNNVLSGGAGSDILDGGSGIDTLVGGTGNDTYMVDNLKDIVSETTILASEIDTVRSSVNWALGANLENLILAGSAHLNGTGNALNNVLTGNAGNNVLNGGAGRDTLIGGAGNDTYVLDRVDELALVQETFNQGNDGLIVTYVATSSSNVVNLGLSNLRNVENVVLSGTGAFTVGGNELNNSLTGNASVNNLLGGAGNDTLDGGAGADTLSGGTGNDTYVVDNLNDVISETSTLAGEIDTVRSSLNWSLGANLENLTLTGSANLNGNGNALNNVLIGNTGNNVLSGGAGNDTLDGGSGIDTLIGGTGNDTYVVDNLSDVISETTVLGSEIDTVRSSVGWILGANLENLTLTGTAFIGIGNDLDNVLIGNAGRNVLDGGAGNDILSGGQGTDSLTGGDGSDRFVFNTLAELGLGSASDTISDFNSLQGDKLDLSKLDANLLTAFTDSFSFIDSNDFTAAGQLRFVDQVLYGNVNGDLGADFEIQLVGVNTLTANDLIA
ncbi:M10 family metallopeptidase [Pseudomonas sp. B21-010]|uniref:M10 family metallopeptidase n=1 Tax=Pseudomonas sp. B21-010 TaxID=2895471 RepID=UPI002852E9D7|nr:M10 family metallopeptidase [Pseudomonas sp. B21-010]